MVAFITVVRRLLDLSSHSSCISIYQLPSAAAAAAAAAARGDDSLLLLSFITPKQHKHIKETHNTPCRRKTVK